ncbi:MAG: glycosyltransferase family 4 protein [Planctomycetota bacterium]
MSLIIVNHTFSIRDGQGQVNRRLVEAMARHGHRVKVVTGDADDRFGEPSVEVRVAKVPSRLPTPLAHQWFAWRVGRTLRAWREPGDRVVLNGSMAYRRCDLNLCHFVHAAWLRSAGHDWAKDRSPKSAYQWLFTRGNAAWERLAYRQARRVIAVSERVKQDLMDHVGVPAAKIDVVPNGLDLGRFTAGEDAVDTDTDASWRASLKLDGSMFVVGFCGDLKTRRKNLDVLLRAVATLPERVHVVAAGAFEGGPYPALVETLGLSNRVHLLGRVHDMPNFFRGCDAFVGLSHYEPWGLMLAEAMASGRAVVAADSVGAAGLIREGENGLRLRDPDDARGLAARLSRLVDDPDLRGRLGRAARETAEGLDWPVIGRRYHQLITALAAPAETNPHTRPTPAGEFA